MTHHLYVHITIGMHIKYLIYERHLSLEIILKYLLKEKNI